VISLGWSEYEKESMSIDIAKFRTWLNGPFACHYKKQNIVGNADLAAACNCVKNMNERYLKCLLNIIIINLKRDSPHMPICCTEFNDDDIRKLSVGTVEAVFAGLLAIAQNDTADVISVLMWIDIKANKTQEVNFGRVNYSSKKLVAKRNGIPVENPLLPFGSLLDGALCSIDGKLAGNEKCKYDEKIKGACDVFLSKMYTLSDFLFGERYFPIMSQNTFIDTYNNMLEDLVYAINVGLEGLSLAAIRFEDIRIQPLQMIQPTPIKTLKRVTCSVTDYKTLIGNAERFLKKHDLLGDIKAWPCLRYLINPALYPKFGIKFAGTVAERAVYTIQGQYIREIKSDEKEREVFSYASAVVMFENSTRANPNLAGRTIAAGIFGKSFVEKSNGAISSPTVKSEVVQQGGRRFIQMEKAGDCSLIEYPKEFTAQQIERVTLLQIFKTLIGDADFHAGNAMVDIDTGEITALDNRLTFCPLLSECDNFVDTFHKQLIVKYGRNDALRLQEFKIFGHIMYGFPGVMTQTTYDTALEVCSDANIDKIVLELRGQNFSKAEIDAIRTRARLIRSMLQDESRVMVVATADEVKKEYRKGDSRFFTKANSLLKLIASRKKVDFV
jgi:hypothetical protein